MSIHFLSGMALTCSADSCDEKKNLLSQLASATIIHLQITWQTLLFFSWMYSGNSSFNTNTLFRTRLLVNHWMEQEIYIQFFHTTFFKCFRDNSFLLNKNTPFSIMLVISNLDNFLCFYQTNKKFLPGAKSFFQIWGENMIYFFSFARHIREVILSFFLHWGNVIY